MVRQKPRRSVEELYATKFDSVATKSQVNNGSNNSNNMGLSKNQRNERERDYTGYLITSNTGHSSAQCAGGGSSAASASANGGGCMTTSRRKSSARAPSIKPEKFFGKDEKLLNLEDIKKDHNIKSKTTRPEKCSYSMSNVANNSNMFDNKNYVNCVDGSHKDMHQNHHHRHHQLVHDDDKDDDTEEFFELIRHTVENAIGKSISDLLNRNFRELSAKVDRFSAELKTTNSLLNKLQTEMNNKVVHYGEENSRHFRYLCMKSEYDKMFYQHHTMLASSGSSSPPPTTHPPQPPTPEKRSSSSKASIPKECEKVSSPCTCRGTKTPLPPVVEPHKSSSEEHSVSNKSSEMGMREVLEHIQRFCAQMQLNELKCDDRMPKGNFRMEDAMKINKQMFEDDDDDFQMSSDGMTPRSDDNSSTRQKYGGTTMRSCSTTRGGTGGGDA